VRLVQLKIKLIELQSIPLEMKHLERPIDMISPARGEKKTIFSNSKRTQIIHITTRCGGLAAKRLRVPVNRLPETSLRARQP
jgi:hypothetical protein